MKERWNKKLEDEWTRKYKAGTAMDIFKLEPEPDSIDYDLRDPMQREAFEQTNAYVFHFLVNMLPKNERIVLFGTPSKRDKELADELGYGWKIDGDYYRLFSSLHGRALEELLQDACFKYGFTYDGILRERV